MEKIYIAYLEADAENRAYPSKVEEFLNLEAAMVTARINERGDGPENTFIVFDHGKPIYESPMVSEYYINIEDYV